MYIPQHFLEDDLATLQAFIQDYSFATLITQQEGRSVASHLPLTFQPQKGPYGTLFGHVALGNQQWKTFDDAHEALVIFQGPHAYISASWYEDPLKSVPTWNYAVVHAYGIVKRMDGEALFQHLAVLTEMLETNPNRRWTLKPDDEYIQRMARGIVGFTIPITHLEGKYKLNQNRSAQDQERVAEVLHAATDTETKAVGNLMQAHLDASTQRDKE